MVPTKPRSLVLDGKTLIEGLSRAVMINQPRNFAQFASLYFTALMQYRKVNPDLDIKDLVREFQHLQVYAWPKSGTAEESKPNISNNITLENKASQTTEDINQNLIPVQAARRLSLHQPLSDPSFQQPAAENGPGQEIVVCKESEKYQPQEQNNSGVVGSLKESADAYLNTAENKLNVLSTTQPLTTEITVEKATALPSTPPLMLNRMEPIMSDEPACVNTIASQEILNRQYSRPWGVLTDTQMEEEYPHESVISKLQNNVSGPVDNILSSTLQVLPEAAITTNADAAGLLSTDLKSTMFTPRQKVSSKSYNNDAAIIPSTQTTQISGETQSAEIPSTLLYNVQLEGNRPIDEMPDKTVYNSTQDVSMAHTINATTGITKPKMFFSEQVSTYIGAEPKNRITFHLPEDAKVTTELPVSSQDPSQYTSVIGQYGPFNVEHVPQNILDPSQSGSKRQHLYEEFPPTVQQQPPAFSVVEFRKECVPKRLSSPLQVYEKNIAEYSSECTTPESPETTDEKHWNILDSQSEIKTVNTSLINRLADLNQQKTFLEKPEQSSNVFLRNEELSRPEHPDQTVYTPYAQGIAQVIREQKNVESQLYSCMEQPVQPIAAKTPTYMVADEAKEVVNTTPHINQNLPQTLVSLPVTTDGRSHASLNQMLDEGAQEAPMYVSRPEHPDQTVRTPYAQGIAQVIWEQKNVESQLYSRMEQPVQPIAAKTPTYMLADEAKEVVNTTPHINQNLPQTLVSLPVTTDGRSHASLNQMLDEGAQEAPMYVSRPEHPDQTVRTPYAQGIAQVIWEQKNVESQLYSCMEQPVQPIAATTPTYMVADEAKEVVNTTPHINQNLPQTLVSLPVTTDGRSHTPLNQMLDEGAQKKAPMYVSVMIRVDELQRLFGTHSLYGEAGSAHYLVEAPVTNAANNTMTGQQRAHDTDYDRPSVAEKLNKHLL